MTFRNLPDVKEPGPEVRTAPLTKREEQVAALVRDGLSNKLIARRLNVGEGTIKAHLHAIFTKLSVQSRFELIRVSRSFRVADFDEAVRPRPRTREIRK
jgi:DNA-binding NarL/FixJ family response regulator